MKKVRLSYLAWPLLATAFVSPGFSQAVPPSETTAPDPTASSGPGVLPRPEAAGGEGDDLVILSPFVVEAEQDTGYQAQSTLAGSRLATPLEDLGAAISVYTKDFMTDIGATNANELLVFATGMEAGGSQSNFSGTNTSIGATEVLSDGPRTNPQSGSRSRGLNAPSFTRNYFLTSIALDGYNTTNVTVNRGPNAILFGVGNPSGVVDNALIAADLNRDRLKAEFRFGDNNSQRAVLDINKTLIPKKLAVRFAALSDRERFNQRPSFENKSRLFATTTYKPWNSTTLSANFERGQTRANRPITVLPFDSINQFWYEAGRPTFDWTFYDDPAKNASAASQNTSNTTLWPVGTGRAQVFGAIVIPYANLTPGEGPSQSYRTSFNGTNSTTNPAANTIRQQIFHPVVNRDLGNDTIQTVETFNIGESGLSAALFPGGIRPAGVKMQGFTNYDAFPFHQQQIDETSRQTDDFHAFNISLAQTGWKDARGVDRVGVELVYNRESYRRYANNAFFSQGNGNHIRIDVNRYLPYGDGATVNEGSPTLNPNFGRPYVYGSSAAQLSFFENERTSARATAFIRHDFNDMFSGALGRWLGRHTLTGLSEEYQVNELPYAVKLRMFGDAAASISPLVTNFNRLPNAFVYLGPSILDGSPLRLNPIQIQPLAAGPTSDTAWFSAPAGLVNGALTQGFIANTPSEIRETLENARPTSEKIKSQAVILHSYWAMDHLITTMGWRKDKDFLTRFPVRNYASDPTVTRIDFDEYDFPSTPDFNAEGETVSFGAVLRWPQKLLRLPSGMDASIFFNKSENFTPDSGRLNGVGDFLPPPAGETTEFGFSVSLFEDKLNLRVNQYETSQTNATINPGNPTSAYTNSINNYYRQVSTFWVGQVNSTPEFDRLADIEELLNALPNMKPLVNFQRTVSPTGVVSGTTDVLPTYYDTQDYVSEGTEVEVVYNPTRQWRIALNVAKQETTLSNLAPGAKAVIAALTPVWQKNFDTPRDPTDLWGGPGTTFTSATNHFGTLLTRDVLVPHATLIAQEGAVSAEQRKYRANLVTNYTFIQDSWLKGFGIGTGVRWQSKYAMGYPTSFNPDGSVFVDIEDPYWSGDDLNVDGWVSYSRKLLGDKVNWRVQLNVRNIAGSTDPVTVTVQPDGSSATTRLPPERRFYLTNTFEF